MIYVADLETRGPDVIKACAVELNDIMPEISCNTLAGLFNELCIYADRVYFHNLSFDGLYLIYYLFRNGYVWGQQRRKRGFYTRINARGEIFYIRVYDEFLKKVEFYDSQRIIPLTVDELADEYKMARPDLDDVEARCLFDCRVVARALQDRPERASMTLSAYIKDDVSHFISPSVFSAFFPPITREVKETLRLAYRGGVCLLNPDYADKPLEDITEIDVNSMYPHILKTELLPYGYPRYGDGRYVYHEERPLAIQLISCAYKVKPSGLSWLSNGAFYTDFLGKYKSSSGGQIVTLALTSVELPFFLKHYETECLEYVCYYSFRAARGVMADYVNYYNAIKVASSGIEREIAKKRNNLLTGIFGEADSFSYKTPYYDKENDLVRYHIKRQDKKYPTSYVPMAIFITAYGRAKLLRKIAEIGRERWIYSDTDSCYFLGDTDKDVDAARLGAWKIKRWRRGRFLAEKQYLLEGDDGSRKQVIAGLPRKTVVPFESFYAGAEVEAETAERVAGGYNFNTFLFTLGEK